MVEGGGPPWHPASFHFPFLPLMRETSLGSRAIGTRYEDSMTVQEWLSQLLARPAAEPVDWDTFSVTMSDATWKALWRDIDATQAYDDGLEVGLRLLQATEHHRARIGARGYEANQILLYRSILAMLDKAERWDEYLAAWEIIRRQTTHCLPGRGDTLTLHDPEYMSFVRRDDGGFGVPPLPYGVRPPKTIAVHFLYSQVHRKAVIERKRAQERAGKRAAERRPLGPGALAAEAIQARLTTTT
jgi:hypothetical protein